MNQQHKPAWDFHYHHEGCAHAHTPRCWEEIEETVRGGFKGMDIDSTKFMTWRKLPYVVKDPLGDKQGARRALVTLGSDEKDGHAVFILWIVEAQPCAIVVQLQSSMVASVWQAHGNQSCVEIYSRSRRKGLEIPETCIADLLRRMRWACNPAQASVLLTPWILTEERMNAEGRTAFRNISSGYMRDFLPGSVCGDRFHLSPDQKFAAAATLASMKEPEYVIGLVNDMRRNIVQMSEKIAELSLGATRAIIDGGQIGGVAANGPPPPASEFKYNAFDPTNLHGPDQHGNPFRSNIDPRLN